MDRSSYESLGVHCRLLSKFPDTQAAGLLYKDTDKWAYKLNTFLEIFEPSVTGCRLRHDFLSMTIRGACYSERVINFASRDLSKERPW
mgnify:CR=1 FL=1